MPDPQSRLRVCVLGRVRAWIGDREADLGPARQRTVFAVLAANGGRLVARDDLISAVWGTSPPVTAAGSVYTYVSGLRRALDPDGSLRPTHDVLTSGRSGYALRLGPGNLDVERFQRLRAEGADLLAAGDTDAAVRRFDDALALWDGDAYAGLAGPFVELDRQRLADLRLTARQQRARALLDRGAGEALVTELTGLVRDHPLREPLHELLMRALHRAGRRAEALQVFRSARTSLVEELGVEPGPALRELHRRVLAGAADLAGPGDGRPAVELAPTVLPTAVARAVRDGLGSRLCFGRADEIGHLRGLVSAVATGAGGAVWIDGERGIGKTELLTLAFADAAGAGCQLAWGAADELGRRVPLRVICRALGLDSTTGPRPADPHPGGREPVAVDRLLAYVRTLCAAAPLVLVIDDMQWADDTTVLVWQRLLATTARLPLLLVAAARPQPVTRALAQLRRSVRARRQMPLSLPPLSAPDVERLVAAQLGVPIGENLRTLVACAGGNPLYAREMVGALVRANAVRTVAGVADVDTEVRAHPPRALLDAVRATLDVLSDDTRHVVRLAALLGGGFTMTDVLAVTGRAPVDLVAALEEALAAHVLVDAGTGLAFRHPLLRQALSGTVPAPLRADLHRHAAAVLARDGSTGTRVAI